MIDKEKMTAALQPEIETESAAMMADVLNASPGGTTVIDDYAPADEDGGISTGEMTPAERFVSGVFGPPQLMVHIPENTMYTPFIQKRIQDVEGAAGRNHVMAQISGQRNAAVREALVLAFALRRTYGPDAVWDLAQAHIFNKPEYAAARQDAEPLIRKYACT